MTETPPCAREALDLLNCVAEKDYDESRCVSLLSLLRSCVERKNIKKFALDGEDDKPSKASEGQAIQSIK